MYTRFFNLTHSPFSIAPDPRYLFMSERHREALAHLLYGVGGGGGFVLLTGEIGAGKTTVCRCFIEQIPAGCRLAYIFNPKLSVEELLQAVCDEFRIALPEGAVSVKGYVDALNRHLLESHARGENNVLVIDEAQNLSAAVLEQLRLLTNLETSERKLLQIILIGQPELRGMLAQPELEQLAQRVIARYHLGSLTAPETAQYIAHRLAVAGLTGPSPFPDAVVGTIHALTHGVPRRINLLCDRALLGAYVENRAQVTRRIVRRAAAEVFGTARPAMAARWPLVAGGVLAGAVLTAAAAWQLAPHAPAAAPAAASVPARPQAAAKGWDNTNADAAVRRLAAQWGVTPEQGDACAAAARHNLRCLAARGTLDELRLLDRPAVLKLRDDPAVPTYAVLTALDDKGATLDVGGKRETIALTALHNRYDGSFTTFWRAPPDWREQVSAGDRGPEVDWLAGRLAQWRGAARPADNEPLAGATLARLREFQAAQQLKADGVAGPKTFIRLSRLGGVREPRLGKEN
ncbi:general secretion pathway protein A [Pseudoduganella flava]|uniref:AAA family ATPase n=1 Tax=Pseudoduganella flava TaxID=871742 RepID=A0A562Q6I7_9BURK|nr:ExeA family protein [Pseudoduganella flava]QGZ41645.1 AAA family ATPase [Pseudoduganella flava]TWI51636.1 general secretion pathway protein A [Pseudoduganella flava]